MLLSLSAEETFCLMNEASAIPDKQSMKAFVLDIVSHGHITSEDDNEVWVWDRVPRIPSLSRYVQHELREAEYVK
jgi:hypothetical protein